MQVAAVIALTNSLLDARRGLAFFFLSFSLSAFIVLVIILN